VFRLIDAIAENCWESGTTAVRTSFDEIKMDITVTYPGKRIEFPEESRRSNRFAMAGLTSGAVAWIC
jgi:hypothetical protein